VNTCNINGCPLAVTQCPSHVKVCGRLCP
jgi:hypothetical protein